MDEQNDAKGTVPLYDPGLTSCCPPELLTVTVTVSDAEPPVFVQVNV
jgi:hypothetical protein